MKYFRLALVLTSLLTRLCCSASEVNGNNVKNARREQCPISPSSTSPPEFKSFLDDGSYTLHYEMLDNISTNKSQYVIETREKFEDVDRYSVKIQNGDSVEIIYFYPQKKSFVKYKDGVCEDLGTSCTDCPWGWYDSDTEHHDSVHFGPSSILRLVEFGETGHSDSMKRIYDIIEIEPWYSCRETDTITLTFYYSDEYWNMADQHYFDIPSDEQFPVQFFVDNVNGDSYSYFMTQFVPFVTDHKNLEIPRGANCESIVGALDDYPVPTVPSHFTFSEEVVVNAWVDGIETGEQIIDENSLFISEDLSLFRFDFQPIYQEETPFESMHPLKVIQDYNTGVQYFIDRFDGNCTRLRLTDRTYDSQNHNHGIFSTGGKMPSGEELLYLTGQYAYLGSFDDRHLSDDRWTSTRTDILNPATNSYYKKAVLEWDFSVLRPGRAEATPNTPVRATLFVYNETAQWQVQQIVANNIFDYKEITLHDEAEFDVFQCYEKEEYEWSYLVIVFPTEDKQNTAVVDYPDVVHHQIFDLILTHGKVSPVRISSIDVTNGINEVTLNYTVRSTMLASVRLLERAPYIYSYVEDVEPVKPGSNEKKFVNIGNAYECAEFCSLESEFDCKSFHVCDHQDCYLSKTQGADGETIAGVTDCEQWVMDLANITFEDPPTLLAVQNIRNAIHEDKFYLSLPVDGEDIRIPASLTFNYYTPDLTYAVTAQFYPASRHHVYKNPDDSYDDIETLEECELICISEQKYECVSLAYLFDEMKCQLSSKHYMDVNPDTDTEARSHSNIYTRYYIVDYKPVLGGVQLNTSSGPQYSGVRDVETCAKYCSEETSIDCRSFDLCFDTQTCRLHTEGYLDGSTGDNYVNMTYCTLFTKRTKSSDFSEYPQQSLPSADHRLALYDTTVGSCSQLCIDDSAEECESFDFCEQCSSGDEAVCGADAIGKLYTCFLSSKHLGEAGVTLVSATNCQHYERDYFGDLTYTQWKNRKINTVLPYGSGDMAGLAFGMILLGVLVSAGCLYVFVYGKTGPLSNIPMSFASLTKKTEA